MRSTRKKILTPLVLVMLGLTLIWIAFMLYPRTTERPAPPYSVMSVRTTFPILDITYSVIQVSSATAEIEIGFQLPAGMPKPPARAPYAVLRLSPPDGTLFRYCPHPACTVVGDSSETWTLPLFIWKDGRGRYPFFVNAHDFGLTYNGLTAAAAIPEFIYQGPVQTSGHFLVGYSLPSAASYDWSSFPTARVNNSIVAWEEALTNGDTAGRVAVGINHDGQSSVDNKTFIAGALLGLAGGAILSAFQEALHPGD